MVDDGQRPPRDERGGGGVVVDAQSSTSLVLTKGGRVSNIDDTMSNQVDEDDEDSRDGVRMRREEKRR